jgi:hypothetical protein
MLMEGFVYSQTLCDIPPFNFNNNKDDDKHALNAGKT